ncbi:MAG TPA: hypothetical protein VGD37_33535 [Kofleriaceae bacterium]|jgi:hypothetical protein
MRAWALALALGGCGFSSSAAPDNAGNGQDAGGQPPADGPTGGSDVDAGMIHVCLGTFVNVCVDAPRASLTLPAGMIDTSDVSPATRCRPYTADPPVDACVIASQSIAIPAGTTVAVTGGKRLILLATETLSIGGTLDAASHRGGHTGPAADTGPCPASVRDPTNVGQGGGGWGGTFGGPGNNGGNTPGGGMGGGAGAALTITALGGGCPGGNGAGANGGAGGHGGGAVLLLAGQSIEIGGAINASGGGGSGGKATNASAGAGGGGGGAGGMIVLEAPSVKIPGRCFANGGGGGEGSSVLNGAGGGESSAPDTAGTGGRSVSVGGDGGNGGVGVTGSKPGANGASIVNPLVDVGGGGAGGGGVGILKILSGDPGAGSVRDLEKLAPPPS